jgi:hypothetical protein
MDRPLDPVLQSQGLRHSTSINPLEHDPENRLSEETMLKQNTA